MNQYEVLYLITPELDEETNKAVIEKFAGIITLMPPPLCPRNWSVTSATMSASCATWLPAKSHKGLGHLAVTNRTREFLRSQA